MPPKRKSRAFDGYSDKQILEHCELIDGEPFLFPKGILHWKEKDLVEKFHNCTLKTKDDVFQGLKHALAALWTPRHESLIALKKRFTNLSKTKAQAKALQDKLPPNIKVWNDQMSQAQGQFALLLIFPFMLRCYRLMTPLDDLPPFRLLEDIVLKECRLLSEKEAKMQSLESLDEYGWFHHMQGKLFKRLKELKIDTVDTVTQFPKTLANMGKMIMRRLRHINKFNISNLEHYYQEIIFHDSGERSVPGLNDAFPRHTSITTIANALVSMKRSNQIAAFQKRHLLVLFQNVLHKTFIPLWSELASLIILECGHFYFFRLMKAWAPSMERKIVQFLQQRGDYCAAETHNIYQLISAYAFTSPDWTRKGKKNYLSTCTYERESNDCKDFPHSLTYRDRACLLGDSFRVTFHLQYVYSLVDAFERRGVTIDLALIIAEMVPLQTFGFVCYWVEDCFPVLDTRKLLEE